ncbi:MAG: hypothetical protein U9O78_00300 [Patescibacteria group bacterium]|nr:hypothetical protein [Patescibacteria group bacterium]
MQKKIGVKIILVLFLLVVFTATTLLVINNPKQINLILNKVKNIPLFNKSLVFNKSLHSPFVNKIEKNEQFPLLKYSIPNLSQYSLKSSKIIVTKLTSTSPEFDSYLFHYTTLGKTMSGAVNIPKEQRGGPFPAIILIRGWVPQNIYQPGVGTKNAAKIFAENGYVTLAPDFFGYGQSDSKPEGSWESRFVKPINILELIKSIQQFKKIEVQTELESELAIKLNSNQLGIWAHSNGGQIALTALEASSQPIPTTLWAPVVAPFPYSILFFSDENEDEGKATRKWVALFEEKYDVFDFSLTQHLDKLTAPLQLHHGTSDEATLIAWSDEFVGKIDLENQKRQKVLKEKRASAAANLSATSSSGSHDNNQSAKLEQIVINFYRYSGANHNLQPDQNWNQAIERDLNFFNKYLLSTD